MKEGTRNLLVGMFVIVSLGVLAALMVAFGEAPSWLGGSEWTLRITGVDRLSGVGAGSPVNLNGVEIGRVQSLAFRDPSRPARGVVIIAGIKKTYYVPTGAVARVYGSTLGFGSGRVDIIVDPGTESPPLDQENARIPGEMHSIVGELISKDLVQSVERMITHIGDLAEAAEPVARNLETLLERRSIAEVDSPGAADKGMTANLATAVERIDDLAANLNQVLGDRNVQDDVKLAVRDLKAATDDIRQTAMLWKTETQRTSDNLNDGIVAIREDLDRSFVKLTTVLDNLDSASTSMASLLQEIRDGQGTAGRLARDPRLYESGVLTLDRLGELIATLQRIIGKAEEDGYIKVGKSTPVGTLKADVPTGKLAAKVLSKFGAGSDGEPLIDSPPPANAKP